MTDSLDASKGASTRTLDGVSHASPRYWLTYFSLGLWRLMSHLPLPVLSVLGATLGEILRVCARSRVAVARRNIGACFPELGDDERERMLRLTFRATGQSIFDTGVACWSSNRRVFRLFEVENRHHLDEAIATGRPLIFLSPHFVSALAGGQYLSRVLPLFAMYKAVRNEVLHAAYRTVCTCEPSGSGLVDFLVGKEREGHPFGLVEHREGLRPAVRRLRAGEHFYYLPDQDLGRRQAVFAPFFGIQTSTVAATSRFAAMSDAIVIPFACWQKPRGAGYRIVFAEPVADYPSDDLVVDATVTNERIEALVNEMPSQYFWLHKRFKSRPDGDAPFY